MVTLLGGALAGAAVVVCGGLYALFVAYGAQHRSRRAASAAEVAFALLVVSTGLLVWSLELDGLWLVMVAVVLVGYRFAPGMIWRLCVATHDAAGATEGSR